MKAPAKLKIKGQEFIREDLLKAKEKAVKMFGLDKGKPNTFWTPEKVAEFNTFDFGSELTIRRKQGKIVSIEITKSAKVQIPKELWAPIYKKIGNNKKLTRELKKLLKAGEPEPLMDFAKKNDLDYSSLRKIMSLVNPELHVGETLSGILAKAVKALKDAGVVDPINIEKDKLWSAWLRAIDEDAKG